MRIIRCRRCKEMFEYEGLPPPCCPSCQEIRNEQYDRVRDFVKEHPGISAVEVHHYTEVPLNAIMQFVEEGNLDIVKFKKPEDESQLVEMHKEQRTKTIKIVSDQLKQAAKEARSEESRDEKTAGFHSTARERMKWHVD